MIKIDGMEITENKLIQAAKDAGYVIVKKPAKYERPKEGYALDRYGQGIFTCADAFYEMFNIFPEGTDMERIRGYIQRTFAICQACELVNKESGFVPDWNDESQIKYVMMSAPCGWTYSSTLLRIVGCGAAVGSKEDSEKVSKLLTEWGV